MKKLNDLFIAIFIFIATQSIAYAQLEIYPAPPSFNVGSKFAVAIDGQSSPVFRLRDSQQAEATRFSFDADVTITITTSDALTDVTLRPLSYTITPQQVSTYIWTVTLPANFAKSKVLFSGYNGNQFQELYIIGNPPVEPVPTGATEYANGLHVATDSIFTLNANTTYYLHPGAVLHGNMYAENQDNITIMGNGIVKGIEGAISPKNASREAHTIETRSCNNLTVKGITFAESNNGGGWHTQTYRGNSLLQNLTVDHVTTLRSSLQSDGIGIGAYQNVSITNCYFRSGDHPIVVGWVSELRDVLFENCVVHPVFKGHSNFYLQGAPSFQSGPGNGIFNNVKFKDCHNPDVVVALVDANFYNFESMHNIVFENVTVDDPMNETQHGANAIRKLVNHVPSFPSEYKFVNLQLPAVFTGGNTVTAPADITIENSNIAGIPITTPGQLDWQFLANDGRLTIVNGTPDTSPPSVPTNLVVSGETSNSFSLTWNASSDNIAVASYDVYLDGFFEGNTVNTNYTYTGLDSETTYVLQVLAKDAAGNTSALSSSENGTTLTGAACSTIISTTASSSNGSDTPTNMLDGDYNTRWISQVGAGSEWATFEFECGTILEAVKMVFFKSNERSYTFDIAVSTDGISFSTVETGLVSAITPSIPLATDFQTFALTNPTIATHIRIIGYGNSVNDWNNYSEIDFNLSPSSTPDTEAPTVPTGLAYSNVTSTGFDVSWTASTDNVGVTGYEVYLDNVSQGTVTGTSYSFTGLTASTLYSVTVSAEDAASNTSAQSTGLEVTTSAGNIVCSVTGITSSAADNLPTSSTSYTTDGDYSTRWANDVNGGSESITFEFSCENILDAVKMVFYRSNERTYTFDIAVSTDGTNFTTVESGLTSAITASVPGPTDYQVFNLTTSTAATHVRIIGYGNSVNDWNNYSEIDFDLSPSGAQSKSSRKKEKEISHSSENNALMVYPNPTKDYLQVKGIDDNTAQFLIFDVSGRKVLSGDIKGHGRIDVSYLTRGVYFINLKTEVGPTFKSKLIID